MPETLTYAAHLANEWLDGLNERPVQATASLEDLRARLSGPLPEEPCAPKDVISTLDKDMRDGHLGSAGGRFFAWVIGGGLESAPGSRLACVHLGSECRSLRLWTGSFCRRRSCGRVVKGTFRFTARGLVRFYYGLSVCTHDFFGRRATCCSKATGLGRRSRGAPRSPSP